MAVGLTVVEPEAANEPTPGIDTEVAFVDDQVSVEDDPDEIEVGLAERLTVGAATTVTVTDRVTVPPAPTAVSVYVVVEVGLTVVEPVVPNPLPTPEIVIVLALETFHDRVTEAPEEIDVGLAVNELIVGGVELPPSDAASLTGTPKTT